MKKLTALGLITLFAAVPVMAEGGRTGGAILARYMGGRSNGMGQAFTAIEGDTENISYNPGGLAFVEKPEVALTYLRGLAEDNNGLVAFSFRVKGINITPGLLYYNSGNITYKNSVTGNTKNITAEQDTVGMLAVSGRPLEGLGVGGTLKYAKFNLAEEAHASGMYFDIGAVYAAKNGLKFGVSQQNMGPDIKFESVGDPPPTTTRAGAALNIKIGDGAGTQDFDVLHSEFIISFDWLNVKEEGSYYNGGVEVSMLTLSDLRVAFRAGYLLNRDVDNFTLGLGAEQSGLQLDYAFGGASHLNNRHQVTLTYKFGTEKPGKQYKSYDTDFVSVE